MFLNINSNIDSALVKFKLVYQLERHLHDNPNEMLQTQQVTLDDNSPYLGLKGTHGLYGSEEWWKNIRSGVIPSEQIISVISDIFAVGAPGDNNPKTELQLHLPDGSYKLVTMRANAPEDLKLFKIGSQIMLFYALDELKDPSSYFGKPYPILIEIAISVD